jgi:predicted transposase YdaD
MVNVENSEKQIEGLELVFIELKKFKPSNRAEKKLYDLWLTFLTEIRKGDEKVPQELMDEDVTREAVKYLELNSYTKEELITYDKYRDIILTMRAYQLDAKEEGRIKGREEGREEGRIEREKLAKELEKEREEREKEREEREKERERLLAEIAKLKKNDLRNI